MTKTVAVSGASGRTGFRIAEELMAAGHQVRLLVRSQSVVPQSLESLPPIVLIWVIAKRSIRL